MACSSAGKQKPAKRWTVREQSDLCKVFLMNAAPILGDICKRGRMNKVAEITSQYSGRTKDAFDVKGRIQKTFTRDRNSELRNLLVYSDPAPNEGNSACFRLTQRIAEKPGVIGEEVGGLPPAAPRGQRDQSKQERALREALGKRKYSLADLSQELGTYEPPEAIRRWTLEESDKTNPNSV